jgi:hypothetical protein
MPDPTDPPKGNLRDIHALKHVQDALRDLQFGHVTVIVQDGVVVQIERLERKRVGRAPKLK